MAALVSLGVPSVSARPLGVPASSAAPGAQSAPVGCKTVAFTADGGYDSGGTFHPEPGDDVTLTTNWCYADHVVTSSSVSYTTTIPDSLGPRIGTDEQPRKGGAVLTVVLYGSYESGVINNTGVVSIGGRVTGRGHHHFANTHGGG
ncbi:MAG: hypothetical protein ACRDY1_10435 [Acidimicrobiales bacterium]